MNKYIQDGEVVLCENCKGKGYHEEFETNYRMSGDYINNRPQFPLECCECDGKGRLIVRLEKIEEDSPKNNKIEKLYCMNCKKEIICVDGVFPGSIVTDGDKKISHFVPGGNMYGNILGYKCCDCWGKWEDCDLPDKI